MFYSQYLLSKQGPLGVIWIAAHLERKLRKKQITETDIGDSVDSILYSEVPIALRISSHLLLGVVKIYSKKVNYLFHDCSEALLKIAQAFQTSAINLSPKAVVAPYHAITLPDSFDFDDLGAYVDPDAAARAGTCAEFEHHVIDRDLITLQEPMEVPDMPQSLFTLDGGFSEEPNPYNVSGLPTEDQVSRKIHAPQDVSPDIPVAAPEEGIQAGFVEEDILPPLPMEEDTDLEDMDIGRDRHVDVEERYELDIDRAHDKSKVIEVEDTELIRASTTIVGQEVNVEVDRTMIHREGPATKDDREGPPATDMDMDHHVEKASVAEEERRDTEEVPLAQADKSPVGGALSPERPAAAPKDDILGVILGGRVSIPAAEVPPRPPKQRKRKRKLDFDNVTVITSFNMKRQLGSSGDLVRLRKKAPCTEYQIWMSQRDDNIDQKFSGPSIPGMCTELKVLTKGILNFKPREPDKYHEIIHESMDKDNEMIQEAIDKDRETIQEALDDQMAGTKHVEGRADVDSDVEEDANGHTLEMETISTMRLRTEAEVVLTPPSHPLQREPADIQQKIEIEAISTVKRRLDFEKPTEVLERDVEAQQAHPSLSPSHVPVEDDAAVAAAPEDIDITEATDFQFVPNAAMELLLPEKAVHAAQQSDASDELYSQGLDFLADSKEEGNGSNASNGITSFSSSFDTDSEHFGKFMHDKSGWASRTRAVALYLKEKFEAQGSDEERRLSLDNILKGRRRKEVARMFFEILVLRSKGFIQVEQPDGVSDIAIRPTTSMMKGSW